MSELLQALTGNDDLYNEIIKDNLKNRTLVINDGIDEYVIENYALRILKWNSEDKDLPVEKRFPITILLNSPGGDVLSGEALIDIMLASITPIRTVCIGLCASMGFHIYLAGSERISFKNSAFLKHDGEISISNSTSKAKDTMKFFDSMENRHKQYVLSRTTMSEELYDKTYESEFWFYAQEGKDLGVVHKIIGEDCSIDYIL